MHNKFSCTATHLEQETTKIIVEPNQREKPSLKLVIIHYIVGTYIEVWLNQYYGYIHVKTKPPLHFGMRFPILSWVWRKVIKLFKNLRHSLHFSISWRWDKLISKHKDGFILTWMCLLQPLHQTHMDTSTIWWWNITCKHGCSLWVQSFNKVYCDSHYKVLKTNFHFLQAKNKLA